MNLTRTPSDLLVRWQALADANPRLRIRDAADALGVSELELLETQFGEGATLVDVSGPELLARLAERDDVMALTRNAAVVHERTGAYLAPEHEGPHVGMVLGPEIDLRCFFSSWVYVVAVRTQTLRSFQVFDQAGHAVHKAYMRSDADAAWFDEWVPVNARDAAVALTPHPPVAASNADVDVEAFRADWLAMQDTHEFFGLLRRHGVHRRNALRIAPESHAIAVQPDAVWATLVHASASALPIMVFVGNRGCIQIHSGPIERVKQMGDWWNVLDPRFNLHANASMLVEAWVVTKPTEDGPVTSLEVFGADGEIALYLFGARKPGIPELPEWRAWCLHLASALRCTAPSQI
jgi:putative hemin transport protein